VLVARVEGRGPDASDADRDVIRTQLAGGLVEGLRWHRLDASGTPKPICDEVFRIVPA